MKNKDKDKKSTEMMIQSIIDKIHEPDPNSKETFNEVSNKTIALGTVISELSGCSPTLRQDSDYYQVNEEYQRDFVADDTFVSNIIESIFTKGTAYFDKLHVVKRKRKNRSEYREVLEGQQRFLSLRKFFGGMRDKDNNVHYQFRIKQKSLYVLVNSVNKKIDVGGMSWGEICNAAKINIHFEALVKQIETQQIHFAEYDEECDVEEICEYFANLNKRYNLVKQELRNATRGEFSKVIRSISRPDLRRRLNGFDFNPLFERTEVEKDSPTSKVGNSKWTSISVNRFGIEEIVDQLFYIDTALDNVVGNKLPKFKTNGSKDDDKLLKQHVDNTVLSEECKKRFQNMIKRFDIMYEMATCNKNPSTVNNPKGNPILGGNGEFKLLYYLLHYLEGYREKGTDSLSYRYEVSNPHKFFQAINAFLIGCLYNTKKGTKGHEVDVEDGSLLRQFCIENSTDPLIIKEADEVSSRIGFEIVVNDTIGTYEESLYRCGIRTGDNFINYANYLLRLDPWVSEEPKEKIPKKGFFPMIFSMTDSELEKFIGLKRKCTSRVASDETKRVQTIKQGNRDAFTNEVMPMSAMVGCHDNSDSNGGLESGPSKTNIKMGNPVDNLKQGVRTFEEYQGINR